MHHRLTALIAAIWLTAACSSPTPALSLSNASVDPTHWCPGGANNAAYDLHAIIHARNDTAKVVTIQSASAQMTLASVNGSWLEPVGDRYDAGSVNVSPISVAAHSSATLNVIIPSACTSGAYGSTTSSSGSYQVKMRLLTSAGDISIAATNTHEILAA